MQIPPNMIRRSTAVAPFAFTELSLSDDEVSSLCVIPCRARRTRRPVKLALAAGMAILSLPACASFSAPAEVVQLANVALSVQKRVVVADRAPEAPPVQERTPSRPLTTPSIVDTALSMRAGRAMEAGQYRAALAMYRKLIRHQPGRVDALFGAALASTELGQTKAGEAYLKKTLALQPDHPLANVLAGFSDQLAHRFGSAREHYGRFLSVDASSDQSDEIRAVLAGLPEPTGAGVSGSR